MQHMNVKYNALSQDIKLLAKQMSMSATTHLPPVSQQKLLKAKST